MRFYLSLLTIVFIMLFSACNSEKNTRNEYVGKYEVQIKLGDIPINKTAIRDSIKAGLAEADKALKEAKIEVDTDLKLNNIDTTTAEGKIEYAAKAFGKSMNEVGSTLGSLAKGMGELAAGIAEGGLDMADNILKNMHFKVELSDDGTIKGSTVNFSNVSFDGSTWAVRANKFYIKSKDGSSEEEFNITKHDENGFVIEKDKAIFTFTKEKTK